MQQFISAHANPLIFMGAGGHAKVLVSLAKAAGYLIAGVCDPSLAKAGLREWRGLTVLGDDTAITHFASDSYGLAMGIGTKLGSALRVERYCELTALGYRFPPLIHPRAMVDESVVIADGVQIMAGVIVQPDCIIGRNTILNTGSSIDHDSEVGEHAHIAPGAVLCGGVRVGDESFIGASSTLLPQVRVGRRCIVAAGTTLARDLSDGLFHAPERHTKAASASFHSSLDGQST